MLNQAMRLSEDKYELDMEVVRKIAAEEGTDENLIARFLLAAYDAGYAHGTAAANLTHAQTAMLIACTAGHA